MELRPYQKEAINAVMETWEQGIDRTLLILPTGTGKTVVFCNIAKNVCAAGARRVLILAHRAELLEQAGDKYEAITGMGVAIEKAQQTCLDSWSNVVVGSVQSFNEKRLERFNRDHFSHIIIDEAHHTLASTYMRVIDHFNSAKLLGVTATADRGDRRNLGDVYKNVAYEMSLRKAIEDGWLCRIQAMTLPIKMELKAPKRGDWSESECASAIEPYLADIAVQIKEQASDRKTVVFLPLIATAQRFCSMLNDIGMEAREVNGQSTDRAETLDWFKHAGKGSVLCNSMLLTEGWDEPSVDCVVVLRPTGVRALYVQMVGRGTRLYKGKENLLILDFLWHTEKHQLMRPAHLVCKNEELQTRIAEILAEDSKQSDLLEAEDKAEKDAQAEREESLRKALEQQRKKSMKLVDPLQFEMSIGQDHLSAWKPNEANLNEYLPMTGKQKETLEKMGINPDEVTCSGHANYIIDILIKRAREGLSTPKQIRCLERFGFRNVGRWSFVKACQMISRLVANNWRLPKGVKAAEY